MFMDDKNLINTYHEFMTLTDRLLREEVRAIEIAPILIKLGLEIYKTVLPENEYERMVDYIYAHKDEINDLKHFLPELH
jgi:hypothetical protein